MGIILAKLLFSMAAKQYAVNDRCFSLVMLQLGEYAMETWNPPDNIGEILAMRIASLILLCIVTSANLSAEEPPKAPGPSKVQAELSAQERYEKALAALNLPALEKLNTPIFGLRITAVTNNSPAEAQGIKVGDWIVKLNDEPVIGSDWYVDHYHYSGKNSVTVWSPETGTKVCNFTAKPGINLVEDSRLEQAYIRGKDRNSVWDKAVVVATRTAVSDAGVAHYALIEARKAGYNGQLLPALTALSSCGINRYDEGLKQLSAVKASMPVELTRTILAVLYRAAISAGQIDVAAKLDKDYALYQLPRREWYPGELYARYSALTEAERGMIDADGNLKYTEPRANSKTPLGFNDRAKRFLEFLTTNPSAGYRAELNKGLVAVLSFGPFTSNAKLKVSFNFKESPKVPGPRDPEGHFSFALTDSLSSPEVPLVEVTCTQAGVVELNSEGYYPHLTLSRNFLHLQTNNDLEILANGPWFQITLNGRKVFNGLLALRTRKMIFKMTASGVQGALNYFEYSELDSGIGQLGAPAKAASNVIKVTTTPKRPDKKELQWFYDVYVTAYMEHGRRNPAWDADAIEALALASRHAGRDSRVELTDAHAACKRAIEQGCDDPLVVATYADMISLVEQFRTPAMARLLKRAADAMGNSSYHALLKFSTLTLTAQFEYAAGLDPLDVRAASRITDAAGLIPLIFADHGIPAWYLRENLTENFGFHHKSKDDHLVLYQPILDAVEKETHDQSTALTFKGELYFLYAWDARGHSFADKVAPEAWKVFGERMSIAKAAFKKAWELDATNSTAMQKLIDVAKNGDSDLKVADCFEDAIRADPENILIYNTMLQAMEPRWGGNAAAMQKFGRSVFESVKKNPDTNCLLAKVLLNSHVYIIQDEIATTTVDKSEQDRLSWAYWEKPEVWADVNDVFTLIMDRTPTTIEKSRFASYAVKCKQYDVAQKLFKDLGNNLVTATFGGPARARIAKAVALRHAVAEP